MSQPFRGIDGQGDWLFGAGKQSYLQGQSAIVADIGTSLWMFLKDCFFSMETGIDWWSLLGSMMPAAQLNIVTQCRGVISGIDGVVRINSVVTNFDRAQRRITITYNVDTIYSGGVVGTVQLS